MSEILDQSSINKLWAEAKESGEKGSIRSKSLKCIHCGNRIKVGMDNKEITGLSIDKNFEHRITDRVPRCTAKHSHMFIEVKKGS